MSQNLNLTQFYTRKQVDNLVYQGLLALVQKLIADGSLPAKALADVPSVGSAPQS